MYSVGVWWMWLGFFIFVLLVLAIDMFLLDGKRIHKVTISEALLWSGVWIICALVFNGLLWIYLSYTVPIEIAHQKAMQFLTAYVIEKSLSVDNLFVFLMIFNYFAVPLEHQRRVLLWGVTSAIFLRLVLIVFGTWIVSELHWILYLFGVFLVITGIKMMFSSNKDKDFSQDPIVKWLSRHLRLSQQNHDERFFVRQNGLWYATPLFLVLVLVEISDLIFAADSIPAVFAVTLDPFIVFTSNVFAILGLRAMYFLLAYAAERFCFLQYGIATVLVLIGIKMLIAPWLDIPTIGSLLMVVMILGVTMMLSWIFSSSKNVEKL